MLPAISCLTRKQQDENLRPPKIENRAIDRSSERATMNLPNCPLQVLHALEPKGSKRRRTTSSPWFFNLICRSNLNNFSHLDIAFATIATLILVSSSPPGTSTEPSIPSLQKPITETQLKPAPRELPVPTPTLPPSTELNRLAALQSVLQHLAQQIQHPSLPLYLAAYITYSAVGLYNVLHCPRYWPLCGLLAVAVAVAIGGWYGTPAMADAMVVGGLLSLVVARGVDVLRRGGDGSMEDSRRSRPRIDQKIGGLEDIELGRE